ncbi:MAG: hypothetical protein KAT75_08545, partial [Dehalococcoidia bacterium]|nr:hypothetical protein [Dehalococcoidia bacterium]
SKENRYIITQPDLSSFHIFTTSNVLRRFSLAQTHGLSIRTCSAGLRIALLVRALSLRVKK